MVQKIPIVPNRVRRVPRQFSWVDHRLVREGRIDNCSHPAAALYLFLVTVGDARGMSYYADASIMRRLSMDPSSLKQARGNLVHVGLIAWKKPLYQVLSLDEEKVAESEPLAQPLGLKQMTRPRHRMLSAKMDDIHPFIQRNSSRVSRDRSVFAIRWPGFKAMKEKTV